MNDEGLDPIPPAARLALAYSTQKVRGPFTTAIELDLRLARIVAHSTEPLLAQMRMAWWRDELAKAPQARATGEPLLAAIGKTWRGEEGALRALVDGWEQLLADPPLPASAAENFAAARAGAFAGVARIAGGADDDAAVTIAAKRWALADLAANTHDLDEKAAFVAAGLELGDQPVRLSRAMRPLLVLDRLARASLAEGGTPLLQGRRNILAAMRLGLFGK